MAFTRRRLLHRCALLPLAALPLLEACNNAPNEACVDPQWLSRGEEQMRKTKKYTDVATTETEQCAGCEFFSAPDASGCGHCEILDGPVSKQGHCTAWASKD